jgi:Ca-activated chloride channel homolog
MKPSQLLIAVVAVVAVIAAIAVSGGSSSDHSGSTSSTEAQATPPKGSVVVDFASSPEKIDLINTQAKAFNRSGTRVAGKPVFVRVTNVSSGEAETKIVKGSLKPTVWSPAGSLWGTLANYEADQPLTPRDPPSIVRSPLVIGMWENEARALGWPKKKIGFADLFKIATSGKGWAAYGHPEFGDFKFVHTNPDFSTAGLGATVAEYYAATGKKEGLTEADVNGTARKKVKNLEGSIIHYGDTTVFIADELVAHGPGYASAAILEEATVLDVNRRLPGGSQKLVAIYPSEGTFYSDSPYFVLNAPWVAPEQKQAAALFQRFLAAKVTPQAAASFGFRPSDLKVKPVAPVDRAHGVDPAQPMRVLGLPAPRVLAAIKKAWRSDRRGANIMLVLDVSGSMNDDGKLDQAKRGVHAFLNGVGAQDRLGLTVFNDEVHPEVPLGPNNKTLIAQDIDNQIADGGTTIYDSTASAFGAMRKLDDKQRINAVVLLTDGEDTDSTRTSDEVIRELSAQGDSANQVRVFTIAYGEGAANSQDVLAEIAKATGGKSYIGSTSDIELVYRSISSFF